MGKQAHSFFPTTPEASQDTSNGASGTLRMMSPVRSVWLSVGTIFSIKSIVLVQETMNNVIAPQCTKSSHSLTLSDVCWNFPDGSNLSIERAELPAFDGAKFTAASRCPYTVCQHLSLLYTMRVAHVVSIYTCECHESQNAEKGCHFAHQALQLPSQVDFADHNYKKQHTSCRPYLLHHYSNKHLRSVRHQALLLPDTRERFGCSSPKFQEPAFASIHLLHTLQYQRTKPQSDCS
jgi:hypothetical protein